MFTKSRVALAAALAASALGSTQALAMPADSTGPSQGSEAPPALDLRTADARGGENTAPGSDLRTADARDGDVTSPGSDLRTADARVGDVTSPGSDLRTADARDGGTADSPAAAPGVQAIQPVVVGTTAPAGAGFDWTAAVIGAAGGLALAVLCGTGVALARRRPVGPTTA